MAELIDNSGVTRFEGTITGGSEAQTARRLLTSGEILALHTAPVAIVPAPGAGKAWVVYSVAVQIIGQTVGYTIAGQAALAWGAVTREVACSLNAPLAYPGDQLAITTTPPGGAFEAHLAANLDDAALIVGADTSDPTGGDGDALLHVAYYIITVA